MTTAISWIKLKIIYVLENEKHQILSSVRSKVERLQLDEMRNMEMEQKKAACVLKVKKPEKAKGGLE